MTGKSSLLVLVVACYNTCLTTQTVEFPTDLKTLCPHSRFCEDEAPATITKEKLDVQPCCSSCSCTKDCGRKRNCCKYEYDVYKLEETLDTVCKQLIAFSDIEIANTPFFYIVDKCPNRSEICSSRNLTDPNSYFPVYSRDSGMLYYNEKCASCHKQANIVRFTPVLTCEKTTFELQKSRQTIVDSDCIVKVIPPNDVDLSTEVCYPFQISNCNRNLKTKERYDDFCYSFNATFKTKRQKSYRNVFCYFCSSDTNYIAANWSKSFEFCPIDDNQKMIGNEPFAVLFGNLKDFLAQELGTSEERSTVPLVCKHENKHENCRPVFCPEGQIYLGEKCQILGKQWYFKMLRINFKLTVPTKYKETLFTIIHNRNFSTDKGFLLIRRGLQDSQLTLCFNFDSDNKTVRYFVAMLYYERLTVEPSSFLERVQMSLRTSWKLHINNQLFYLTPQLNRFLRYNELSDELRNIHVPNSLGRKDYTRTGTNYENMYEEVQIHFAAGPKSVFQLERRKGAFFITKLFFCKLVELHDHEFKDYFALLKMNNGTTYLGDGEFTWVYKDQSHKPFICAYVLQGFSGASSLLLPNVGLLLCIGKVFNGCE